MPIVDTSMYQNAQGIDPSKYTDGVMEGAKLSQMRQNMALQGLQQQEQGLKLADMTRDANFKNLVRNSFVFDPATGQTVQDPAKAQAAQQADPMAWQALQLKKAQDARDAEKADLELQTLHATDAQNRAARVTDQASYDNFLQWGKDKGHLENVSSMPSVYDPDHFKAWTSALGTHAQQLAEAHQSKEEKVAQQKADAESSQAATAAGKLPFEAQKVANEKADLDIKRLQYTDGKQREALQQTQQELESARGNPAVSQALSDHYAAGKVSSLVNQFKDPNQMNPNMVSLVASEVAKMAQGGSPTLDTLKEIRPETVRGNFAESAQKYLNAPTPANQGEFIKQLQGYAQSLDSDARSQIQNKVNRVLDTRKRTLHEDDYRTLKSNYADRLMGESGRSPGGSPPAPRIGAVEDGHQYIGGDPANPKSWKAL